MHCSTPKLRRQTFEAVIIERCKRRETLVEEALIEMYLAGVSMRRVEDIIEALWGTRVSPSTVSDLNKKIYATIDTGATRRSKAATPAFISTASCSSVKLTEVLDHGWADGDDARFRICPSQPLSQFVCEPVCKSLPKACKAELDNGAAASQLALVIGNIRHKALRNYWIQGRAEGLNGEWLEKLRRIMSALEAAERPGDMNYPGSYFHALKGGRAGRYSVRLTANYRVTFGWNEDRAVDVNIEDYHR